MSKVMQFNEPAYRAEVEAQLAKEAKISAYRAKQEAKHARTIARAAAARKESGQRFDQAHEILSIIPMGQPILVGHHSEKRHRRDLEKVDTNMRKGFELEAEAAALELRAAAQLKNKAIFSEDPEAGEKLAAKVQRLEERQTLMVAANKLVRKGDRAGLAELGFTDAQINKLFTPDFCGRLGFPDYETKNNNANIRRLKGRIEVINNTAGTETRIAEKGDGSVRMEDNAEDNRIRLYFKGKPADTVRQALKHAGFRWTPSLGCWQAYRNANARYYAEHYLVTG